jgi:predicted ATPase
MLSMLPIQRLNGEERFNGTHFIKTGNSEHDSLLKTAAIYGANASGKSNLLSGLARMRRFVLENLKELRRGRKSAHEPFAFSKDSTESPTLYEIQFLSGNHLYRYGFEIGQQMVEEEWLYRDEKKLFHRVGEEIDVSDSFQEGKGKETQTRKDALFLTVCSSYNGSISNGIISLFQKVRVWGSIHDWYSTEYPAYYLWDNKISGKLLELIRLADPGISHFRLLTGDAEEDEVENNAVEAVYGDDTDIALQIEDLSSGTKKMMHTAGVILRAIDEEGIVVIDEIDIQLHPLLIEMILEAFHSHPTSKAQLIFTTHNTYPLRKKMLRRDQVWFVNKMPDFSSHLVNFAEFKVRPDAPSYDDDYMNGRFGGIPTLEIPEIFGTDEHFEKEGA